MGEYLLAQLRAKAGHLPVIGDVRGAGLLVGVELVTRQGAPAVAEADAVLYAALGRGLSFKTTMGSVLTLSPPLNVSRGGPGPRRCHPRGLPEGGYLVSSNRQRIVVVGGGILGTMHALFAVRTGASVVHLERYGQPRGGRRCGIFGLVWVSGRPSGAEPALSFGPRTVGAGGPRRFRHRVQGERGADGRL